MQRVRTILALACAGSVACAACVSLAGLSDDAAPIAEAGVDAEAVAEAAPPPDPCRHAVVPLAPVTDDDPRGDVGPVIAAVKDLSIAGAGGGLIGYDLDGVCSCFPDRATAHRGDPSCVAPEGGAPSCDGDGGVDAVLGTLLAAYPQLFGGASAADGGPTQLVKITRYNGRANDAEVFVALVPSDGIFDEKGCADAGADATPPFAPTWRGCDRWTVGRDFVLPGTTEPSTYLTGFVVDHVLVVPTSPKRIALAAGRAKLGLSGVVLTARLIAVDAQLTPINPPPLVGKLFRINDGVLSARASTADLLRALATAQAATDGGPLCGFPNFFGAVKAQFVCPSADIASNAALDFTAAHCDALSMAAAFEALPAQFGESHQPDPTRCQDPSDPKLKPLFDCP